MRRHSFVRAVDRQSGDATGDSLRRSSHMAATARPARFHQAQCGARPQAIATEGGLWGRIQSHKFLCGAIVLADDAKVPPSKARGNVKLRELNIRQHVSDDVLN
jgi:hypothetical protein